MPRSLYSGPPTTIVIEASLEVIHKLDLDTWAGEQYDRIHNVISIEDDGNDVTFETTRSIEAYKRNEPNAGRGLWRFPHTALERVMERTTTSPPRVFWGTPIDTYS